MSADQVEETIQEPMPEETQEVENQVEEEVEEEVEELEDDSEEVDYDGEKYRVPKKLKDALLRQEDYTRKTQEVAEQRRALESEVQQFQQAAELQRQNLQGYAQLAALQSQLEQYSGVNWSQFSSDDPQAAQQAFFQYQQLKDATQTLKSTLQQQETQTLQAQHQLRARQLEQGKAELARAIPGFNEQLAVQIVNHGKEYGFSESELKSVMDPRMVKVLNDARLYRESVKKATTTKQPEVKPAGKIQGKAPVKQDPEKMSTEEWLKWRNKQLAKR